MLTRRQLLGASALLGSLLLTGCGFHLRGSFTAPFEKLYIQGGFNNPLIVRLRHMLEAGSNHRAESERSGCDFRALKRYA